MRDDRLFILNLIVIAKLAINQRIDFGNQGILFYWFNSLQSANIINPWEPGIFNYDRGNTTSALFLN